MKYAGSFHHKETISAAGTTYSPWFDISWANELYAYSDSTMDVSGTLSVAMTVERFLPYRTAAHVDVLTFTALTGATTEEEYGIWQDEAAPGTENKLGMRVRFKYVTTYTDGTISIYSTIFAKRV